MRADCEERSAPTVQRRWDFSLTDRRRNFERRVHPGLKQPRKPTSRAFSERAARRGFFLLVGFVFSAAEMNDNGCRLCLAFLAFFRARVSRRDGQDPHRVLLRCSPRGQQERLPQLRGRTSWLERPARVPSHVARAFRDDRTTHDRPRKNPLGSRAPNRARFTTERADPPLCVPSPHHRSTCARTTPRTL